MRMFDLIQKKKRGIALEASEIQFFFPVCFPGKFLIIRFLLF